MLKLKTNVLKYKKPDGSMDDIGVVVGGQIVDDALSKTSANPIQNKVVAEEFERISEENAKFSEEFDKIVIVNEDLVNPDEIEKGILAQRVVSGSTIVVVNTSIDYSGFDTTGAIPVKAGEPITAYPYARKFAAFTQDMTYVPYSFVNDKTDGPYTYVPNADGFVRVTFPNSVTYAVYYGDSDKPMTDHGTFVNGHRIYTGSVTDDKLAEPYVKKAFCGKTLMNFGDSIAAGDGNGGKSYADMIANANKMTLYDYALGGATITTLRADNTVQVQIDEAIAEHAGESIDYILLEGGTNDVSTQDVGELVDGYNVTSCDPLKFVGAVETAIYKLRDAFPLAKIIFVSAHQMATRSYERQHLYHDALVPACKKWSVPIVDVFAEGGINSYIDSVVAVCFNLKSDGSGEYDKTHPNAVGYSNFYVPMVEAAMNCH